MRLCRNLKLEIFWAFKIKLFRLKIRIFGPLDSANSVGLSRSHLMSFCLTLLGRPQILVRILHPNGLICWIFCEPNSTHYMAYICHLLKAFGTYYVKEWYTKCYLVEICGVRLQLQILLSIPPCLSTQTDTSSDFMWRMYLKIFAFPLNSYLANL
jgi:hypothetical protein